MASELWRPCVCEHPARAHPRRMVEVDNPKADYAILLGSCHSCSCPRFAPSGQSAESET